MDYLEQFRKAFSYSNVNVEEDYISYSVTASFGEQVSKEAKQLIEEMQLPLTVELSPLNNLSSKDTFIVKLKHD